MYLYEINLDNLDANDDTAIYSKRPRQCLPYAVITLTAKQKILKPVVKPSQPPSRPLMNIAVGVFVLKSLIYTKIFSVHFNFCNTTSQL